MSWVLLELVTNFEKFYHLSPFFDGQDREAVEDEAVAFQLQTSEKILAVGPNNSINSDQAGFNYEMHSGRTLDIQGEKKVERIVQSKNAATHSFTIMPMVSASGELKIPTYVVLQESEGKFGPQVSIHIWT